MDITVSFKACIKTIRLRNKAFGMVITSPENDKHRILNSKLNRTTNSEFISRAKEVLSQISRLRDFLLEHRKAYLNFANHLSDLPKMSDIERDKIDSGAQRIMKNCSHLILEFKRKSALEDGSSQLLEHRDNVLDLIEEYLKTVCKIYSEQKAIRMKRVLETQKLSRLEAESLNKSSLSKENNDRISLGNDSLSKNKTTATTNSSDDLTRSENYVNGDSSGVLPCSSNDNSPNTKFKNSHIEPDMSHFLEDDQLSAEELQMFESENEQLYNELNSITDEVRQIESKVVKIAELQEIFTEKVLEQERDIERIGTTLIGTTENLKDANQHIRQAIESSASLRVYVLFFLLVMAFTLLFLDWYNP